MYRLPRTVPWHPRFHWDSSPIAETHWEGRAAVHIRTPETVICGCCAGLHLEGLTLAPPGGGKPLTAALHASIGPGQSLLVVGPSGCGKSSLLRAVAGALCAVPRVLRTASKCTERAGPILGH
jgi:ABC transporter